MAEISASAPAPAAAVSPSSAAGDRSAERRRTVWLKRLAAGQRTALAAMVGLGLLVAGVAVGQAWVIAGLIADAIGGAALAAWAAPPTPWQPQRRRSAGRWEDAC